MQFNKSMIVPILAFAALMIKHFTGFEVQEEALGIIADAILAVLTVVGLFTHPKKPLE